MESDRSDAPGLAESGRTCDAASVGLVAKLDFVGVSGRVWECGHILGDSKVLEVSWRERVRIQITMLSCEVNRGRRQIAGHSGT